MEGCDETNSDTFKAMQRWQNRWTSIFSRTRYNRQKNLFPFERGYGILCAYERYMKRIEMEEYVINISVKIYKLHMLLVHLDLLISYTNIT